MTSAYYFKGRLQRTPEAVWRWEQTKFFKETRAIAGNCIKELITLYHQKKSAHYTEKNYLLTQFRQIARERKLQRGDLDLAQDDDELYKFCEVKAVYCEGLLNKRDDALEKIQSMLRVYKIKLTKKEKENIGSEQMLLRFCCPKWWRSRIKKISLQVCEQIWREMGQTKRGKGVYVSEYTFKRFLGNQKKNRDLLESLEMENNKGQSYTLKELADLGTSNLEKRRGELMVRMRGFENYHESQPGKWAPMFYTVTCPSKFHMYSQNRQTKQFYKNKKYNGATPKEAQAYLNDVWVRFRSEVARQKIKYFGLRVAEPHHDGCPHWHLLLFVEKEKEQQFTAELKKYALEMDGFEPGAQENRFEAIEIEKERGSATGYIAKYVSKNIDGFAVSDDWEAEDFTIRTAARVRAWASCWGIRQFQQIGGAPVGVYRELRRLSRHPEALPSEFNCRENMDVYGRPEQLNLLLESATSANWSEYNELMGGVVCPRMLRPVRIENRYRMKLNAYREEVKYIAGLSTIWFCFPLRTRFYEWKVKLKNVGAKAKKVFGKRKLMEKIEAVLPDWAGISLVRKLVFYPVFTDMRCFVGAPSRIYEVEKWE